MNLAYGVKDRPTFGKMIVFAFQQVLAILAATIVVPVIINGNVADLIKNGAVEWAEGQIEMNQAAALFGAGVGTIVYLLFTRFRSPVFLGSSFAFLGSMTAAFAGAISAQAGFVGLILGAVFAGLVYVVIAIAVRFAGVKWVNKLMPAVVIGPTVSLIGLSLAGNAIGDAMSKLKLNNFDAVNGVFNMNAASWVSLACALVTLITIVLCSVYGKKMGKLIPFIIGIAAGYAVASCLTLIGMKTGTEALKVVDWSAFSNLKWVPEFTFLTAFKGIKDINGSYIATIAFAYIPVAFVVFAEHIADHKNLSSIIGEDLLKDPGLHRTLLGDGIGSMAGAFFGGCPNTTYGESIGCVAITGNASVVTILTTAIICMAAAFFAPFVALLSTIPSCVMGGVCVTLYGFIAVSGLKMIQKVDLGENRNLFVVATILITGIGGLALQIGTVTITKIAVALILGIIVNLITPNKAEKAEEK